MGLLLGALLFFIGFEIHGPLTNADQVYTVQAEIGAALLNLFLFLGTLGFGFLISSRLKLQPLLTGVLFMIAASMGLTHLHLLTPQSQPIAFIIIFIGYLFLPKRFSIDFLRNHFLIFIVCLGYLIQSSRLHFHTDTLMYHFLGPRDWVSRGGYVFSTLWSYVPECSYWEYFLVWPNLIFGAKETYGAFDVHLSAQWLIVLFGFLPSAMILTSLSRRWTTSSLQAQLLALLSLVVFDMLRISIWIGKNDWFAVAISLACYQAWVHLREKQNKTSFNEVLFGVLIGITFVTKYTTVYLLLPLTLLHPFNLRTIVGALIGGFPILLRNVIETGNPVFPIFTQIFGIQWMSLEFIEYQRKFENLGLSFQTVVNSARIRHWLHHSPWVALFPAALFFKSIRRLVLPVAIGLVWFLLFHPEGVEDNFAASLRLIGGVAPLVSFFTLVALHLCIQQWKKLTIVLLVILCLWAHRDFSQIPKIFSTPMAYLERSRTDYSGAMVKAWLRSRPDATTLKILTTGDNLFYYVSHLNISSLMEQAEISIALHGAESIKAWLAVLRQFSPDYILETRHWTAEHWSFHSQIIESFISKHPEIEVLQTRDARLIDFKLLKSFYFPFCEKRIKDDALSLSHYNLVKPQSVW